MGRKKQDRSGTVEVERNGMTYTATYEVMGRGPTKKVTIHSDLGAKSAQVRGNTPAAIARFLLGELLGLER